MFLVLAFAFFSVFVLNVVLGAFSNASFMGDTVEMLVLFGASAAFVVAILKRESDREQTQKKDTQGRNA